MPGISSSKICVPFRRGGGAVPEALAFIEAAGITDSTQKSAINTFVKDLKAINAVEPNFVNFETPADSICLAIYPFVGGTATTHKYNLINPVDSNEAFRLTITGGISHNAAGIKNDGATGSITTNLSTSLISSESHGVDVFGWGTPDVANRWLIINGGNPYISVSSAGALAAPLVTVGQSKDQLTAHVRINQYSSSGLWIINRVSNAIGGLEVYYSGIKTISTAAVTNDPHVSNFNLLSLGASFRSSEGLHYAAIRQAGVSEAAIRLYETAILKLQLALNRLPIKNIVFEGHSFFHNQPATGGVVNWLLEKTIYRLNAAYDNRIYSYVGSAVSGSTIANLVTRKATAVDAYKVTSYGMKNIIPIWIGVNDITTTAGTGLTAYAALKSYYNSLVGSGWIPIVITMTERGGGDDDIEVERLAFNNAIRTDLAPTYLIDTDLIVELADSTNATYFQADKIHLTAASNDIVSTALAALIASI